ncbi:EAL domain-containing protein [Fuchsiella alkaliacetigena]|uniref:EAL domain-containing protein n=1 Tax=Fuchsiella alkaliacetigena TaxID=957042 RepID=UPI002009F94B|nr:EAL domain-containing protein [Fuchsiella alkaliacetigena]MCK8825842.1 EAL domain-containing protein [Fuchsiella alkaliacetigena]
MKKYLFILELTEAKQLINIFGESVITNIKKKIDYKFKKNAQKILERHQIISEVKSYFGRWQLSFIMEESKLMVDPQEQQNSLIKAAQEKIEAILKEEFGAATGSKIDFKLAIFPYPENSQKTKINEYLTSKLAEYSMPTEKYKNLVSKTKFEEIINNRKITTYLQPLINLKKEKIIGYEVLTRGPENTPLFSAADLFGAANHFGLMKELELAAALQGLEWGLKLPDKYKLSINASPELLIDDNFYQQLSQNKYQQLLPRTILEITEHMPLETVKEIQQKIEALKELGISIALDDTGCGFFDMNTARKLRPEILKLCITVINKIDKDPKVQAAVCQTTAEVKELKAAVLGEGVERKEQVQALKKCNVDFTQGYYYEHPQAAVKVIDSLNYN